LQVQEDFEFYHGIRHLPRLAACIFLNRCTPLAILRYSLFISCSMCALLFTCDMVAASAIAAFFFQASGGALAKDVDPKCQPASVSEQIGRTVAVGLVTVILGIIPSLILSKLHQRDFVTCRREDSEDWQQQLRVWQIQDGIIYCCGYAFVAFCLFFDLVFIANVTPEDGLAWAIACITSMAQTLFGVPALMTLLTVLLVLASWLSEWVQKEVTCLCLVNVDNTESRQHSSFRREPRSRWNSRARRRSIRTSALELESEEDEVADDFHLADMMVDANETDFTAQVRCSDWKCRALACEKDAEIQGPSTVDQGSSSVANEGVSSWWMSCGVQLGHGPLAAV